VLELIVVEILWL